MLICMREGEDVPFPSSLRIVSRSSMDAIYVNHLQARDEFDQVHTNLDL